MAGASGVGSKGTETNMQNTGQQFQGEQLSSDLNYNLNRIKEAFYYPQNVDLIIREIQIKALNTFAVLIFMHGMIEEDTVQRHVIEPLLIQNLDTVNGDPGITIMQRVISSKNTKEVVFFKEVIARVVSGETIVLIHGHNKAVSVTTTGYEARAVEQSTVENTVRGPKEAFTESARSNRSLIRKHLRYEKLVTESIIIQCTSFNEAFIMYIKDIANPELLEEVKRRINSINTDNIPTLSELDQYIQDRPYSLVPTTLITERPDRVVSFLQEGHIAILMNGSPDALIVPITFWSLFHTAEDMYLKWAYGNFIRFIRICACYIALLVPGLFIALTNYHVDMIPTDLVMAIAASRERLPFPVFVEVILMELAFELIREAGIRVPTPIGPTIGIVGALILGQAAVEASVVSPILVIIVSITGLSSFAIPELSLSYMLRIGRFLFLFSGMFLGFYGVGVCFVLVIAYTSTVKSFGVSFYAPVAPHYRSSKDVLVRPPIFKMWLRPDYLKPKDKIRRGGKKGGTT